MQRTLSCAFLFSASTFRFFFTHSDVSPSSSELVSPSVLIRASEDSICRFCFIMLSLSLIFCVLSFSAVLTAGLWWNSPKSSLIRIVLLSLELEELDCLWPLSTSRGFRPSLALSLLVSSMERDAWDWLLRGGVGDFLCLLGRLSSLLWW